MKEKYELKTTEWDAKSYAKNAEQHCDDHRLPSQMMMEIADCNLLDLAKDVVTAHELLERVAFLEKVAEQAVQSSEMTIYEKDQSGRPEQIKVCQPYNVVRTDDVPELAQYLRESAK